MDYLAWLLDGDFAAASVDIPNMFCSWGMLLPVASLGTRFRARHHAYGGVRISAISRIMEED